ncbi:unnamed protein product [Caenorhabditis angaria]|uniref:Serpentine Receptor, class H n=1 Tax=Caenorhabditis angaria TaxID=860376 RepID=A0A9P1N4M2_9PELO|nr:unnamed protein product [Caenorhabditis angaria]
MNEYYTNNYTKYCKDVKFDFFDSYDFLFIFGRSISVVIIPIDIFGMYCIIKKTPKKLKTKGCLMYLQSLIIFLDILLTLCMTPYVYFPTCSGFTIGIFRSIGFPMIFQCFIAIVGISTLNFAVPIIFENRHNILVRSNFKITRKCSRILFYLFNVTLPFFCQLPVFLHIPDQIPAALEVLKRIPCPTIEYFQQPIFTLTLKYDVAMFSLSTTLFVAFIQILFFSIHSFYHLRKISNFASVKTQKLQKAVFSALSLQISVSTAILILPIFYFWYAFQFNYYRQGFTNISFLMIASHGCFATVTMLFCHKNYREYISSFFCKKKPRIDGLHSNTPSFQRTNISVQHVEPIRF